MNEERPIRLLRTRWDRGLLAMVGWSFALHVAAAGGVVALLPWAGARASRPIPSYTVELTTLSAAAAKGVGGKPKSGRLGPARGKPGRTRVKSKQAAPMPKPPKATRGRAKETSKDAEKATAGKKPEPARNKKDKESPKKSPPVKGAKPDKSTAPAKKAGEPTKTVAVKKTEPKKAESKKADQKKPTSVAAAKHSGKAKSAPAKKEPKTKSAPKPDAATGARKVTDSTKPRAQKESAAGKKKAAGADGVGTDEGRRKTGGDAELDDDSRYAAAIESIRRRVERGTNGAAAGGDGQVAASGEGAAVGGGDRVVGTEFLIYYNIMISRIRQAWVWVGHDQSLSVTVRFAIEPDGEIRNVRIDRPSGDSSYDRSVVHAVRKANPLPSPPAAYSRDFRQVELTFRPGDLREAG